MTTTSGVNEAVVAIALITVLVIVMITAVLSILTIIGEWKVFKKAGKPGWAAIVPIYNMWVLYEISGIKPIYIIFTLIGSTLAGIGNVFSSFGQTQEITGLVIASIPINLVSIGFSMAGLVFSIMAALNLAKYFNKSSGFGIGLAFLPFVFYPMLGFSKTAVYNKTDK